MECRRIGLWEDWKTWTPRGRALVFMLAASSIWCLLAEFYGFCSMRTFTFFISLPALSLLTVLAVRDRLVGDGRLWRGVMIGAAAGFAATVAYDLFRVPFVFSRSWGLDDVVPALPLFKVFPMFGAMILGGSSETAEAQTVGWIYHFSNGITFGIMFTALVGERLASRWLWAIAMAVGIEMALLLTPYTTTFSIPLTMTFVAVTLAAHLIFGATLGLSGRWLEYRKLFTPGNR